MTFDFRTFAAEDVDRFAEALDKMRESVPKEGIKARFVIARMRPAILELMDQGYGLEEVHRNLKESGLDVSFTTFRRYFYKAGKGGDGGARKPAPNKPAAGSKTGTKAASKKKPTRRFGGLTQGDFVKPIDPRDL